MNTEFQPIKEGFTSLLPWLCLVLTDFNHVHWPWHNLKILIISNQTEHDDIACMANSQDDSTL